MNKPVLSSRQRDAQRLYNRKFAQITVPILWLALIGWGAFLYYTKIYLEISSASLLDSMTFVLPIVAGVCITGVTWAHKRAMETVRRAELLDEETEIIRRTATTFAGEDLSFGAPTNRWSQLGFILMLVGVAALIGGFELFFAAHILEKILATLGFAFFCGFAILTIAISRQPNLSLDERGVFGYYRNFWPRLVSWDKIASAHFHQANNFHDGIELRTITLKNADDKTLLKLTSVAFTDAPPGFEARFAVELKRRLIGETET